MIHKTYSLQWYTTLIAGKQYRVVIISTVRTEETIGSGKQQTPSDDYLGFLSDWRQLNTAFTRAQSLLIVVGNPKTLCFEGRCCRVWTEYFNKCKENGSLYPNDLALDEIRAQSPITCSSDENKDLSGSDMLKTKTLFTRQMSNTWTPDTSEDQVLPESQDAMLANIDFDDLDQTAKNDLILKWLAPQIEEDNLDLQTALSTEVVEEDDHITFKRVPTETENDIEETNLQRCVFRVDFDRKLYAVPVTYPKASKKILIGTNTQRKTALDGDHIDVKVFKDQKNEQDEQEYQPYGKVVNIVQRSQVMEGKKIICFPDPFSDNLMVPCDQSLPKIIIRILKNERESRTSEKGGPLKIPIYQLRYRDANADMRSSRSVEYRFDRFVEVTNQDRPNKLFIVQWLHWNERHYYPLGTVVDYTGNAENVQDGLRVLKLVYSVPPTLDNHLPHDVPCQDGRISSAEIHRRLDLRHQVAFTIDPAVTQDYDDALSIEETSGGYTVWIHIADVAFFIRKDSQLDGIARQRATSFYPHKHDPIHMFPPEISTWLCSLVEGQDRLAVSFNIHFDKKWKRKDDNRPITERFQRTVINCRQNLTYNNVQQAILNNIKDGIYERVQLLYKIASYHREERLGLRKYAEHCNHQTMSYPQAHILVEEFMIMTNHQVAKDLMKFYPTSTPVRRQQPPLRSQFLEWMKRNEDIIKESLYLRSQDKWMYSLTTDASNSPSSNDHGRSKNVKVLKHIWKEVTTKARMSGTEKLATLLCTDTKHPEHAAVLTNLHHIMPKGEYVNSGDHKDYDLAHKDLRLEQYTHFTSPLRRYIDLAGQRQLLAALSNEENPPHCQDDIREICRQCSVQSARSAEFEIRTRALHLASEVKQRPVKLLSFVESVSPEDIVLGFSAYPSITAAHQRGEVRFNHLKPFKEPTNSSDKTTVSLTWRERIYHMNKNDLSGPDTVENRKTSDKLLDSTRFVELISGPQWMKILKHISRGDIYRLRTAIADAERELNQYRMRQENQGNYGRQRQSRGDRFNVTQHKVQEVSSINNPFVVFKRPFTAGDVLQVQLQAGLKRGILAPRITLINITPQFELCLEHRRDPVSSFATIVDEKPRRGNIRDYQASWIPILEMESTLRAVESNETIIVHGVQIDWFYRSGDLQPRGSFSFTKSFCRVRHIKFFSRGNSCLKQCFLCIRYRSKREASPLEYDTKLGTSSFVPRDNREKTFVAHAYIVDVDKPESTSEDEEDEPEDQIWTVYFEVLERLSEFPMELLTSSNITNEPGPTATIEIIPKALPDR